MGQQVSVFRKQNRDGNNIRISSESPIPQTGHSTENPDCGSTEKYYPKKPQMIYENEPPKDTMEDNSPQKNTSSLDLYNTGYDTMLLRDSSSMGNETTL